MISVAARRIMRILLSTLFSLTAVSLFSANFQWDNPTGGSLDWATNANWSPATGFPNAMNDEALFGTPPMGPLLANVTVTSAASKTVGRLLFGSNATAFTYLLATGYTINMSATGNPLIQLQTGAQNSTIASNIGLTAGTTLEVDVASGKTLTTSGVIASGTGMGVNATVNYIGQGTWTISGGSQNIFTGGLNVTGSGTVNLAKSVSTNAFNGNLTITNGTVRMQQDNQMPNGSVININGGTLDMNGFSEGSGTLQFYSGQILNATTIRHQMEFNPIVLRNVTINANLRVRTLGGGSLTFDTTNGGTAVMQGIYDFRGQNLPFNIPSGGAAVDLRVESVLQGGALTKNGNGTMLLAGVNTYTGTTTVSAGTLLVGDGVSGSLANTAVTVGAAGTLGGLGTIGTGATPVTNNGIVAPGTSPGTLTINGNYTQGAAGSLNIELQSPVSFDKLVVNTGAVSLNGTLNVDLLSGNTFTTGAYLLTILDNTAGTGVTGTFSTFNMTNFCAGSTGSVIYNPNTVQLSLNLVACPPPTPPPPPPPPVPPPAPVNAGTVSAPQLNGVYNGILSFSQYLNHIRPYKRRLKKKELVEPEEKNEPILLNEHILLVDSSGEIAQAAPLKAQATTRTYKMPPSIDRTWGVFAEALGSLGTVYATSLQSAYRYQTGGGHVGFDYVGDQFAAGACPGYELLKAESINDQFSFRIESVSGTAFATFVKEGQNIFMDVIGGGGWQNYHFSRNTFEGMVTGKTTGWQANVYADAGYIAQFKKAVFTPYVGAGYVYAELNGYSESGPASQAFDIGSDWLKSLRTFVGTSASYTFPSARIAFIPEIRGLWMHEFMNSDHTIPFASAPLQITSQMQVLGLAKNTFVIGALLRFITRNIGEFYTSYDYECSGSFHTHLLLGGLEKRW